MTDVVRFIASFKPKYGLGLCGNFSLNWQSTLSNSDLAGLSAREARAAEYHQWEKLVSNASNKFWFWEDGPNVRPPTPSCKPGWNFAFQPPAHFDGKSHSHPDF